MRRRIVAGLVVVLGTAAGAVAMADLSGSSARSFTFSDCVKTGPDGPYWNTHAPGGVADAGPLADTLQRIADANPGEVSGVALCWNYSGVLISVARPSDAVLGSIEDAGRRYPHAHLLIQPVAAGLTAQVAAMRRVTERVRMGTISLIGPNCYTGGLSVGVLPSHWPMSAALRHQIEAAATNNGAIAMPLDFKVAGPIVPAANRHK